MRSAPIRRWLLLTILLPALSYAQPSTGNHTSTKHKEDKMVTTEKNKEIVRSLYERSMNKGNMALLKEYISDDYTGLQGKKGAAAFGEPITALIKAFPDIQWKIEDMVGEGDKVMVRWKWQGTHTGQFANFTATNKTMSNDGMGVFELKNGKVVSSQVITDRLGFLQQVGALPADISTLTNRSNPVQDKGH